MTRNPLLYSLLLLAETLYSVHGEGGCGFCQGGSLSNPDELVALSSPYQTHSCLEWQEKTSLTEDFHPEACDFFGPFYEAICGCSNLPTGDQCHLCGSSDMVLNNPSKGLLIPRSNSEQILCGTVHTGVYMGAVSANDCQVLRGIVEYCGGCIPAEAGTEQGTEPENRSPTLSPTIESLVSIVETGEPSAAPTTMEPSTSPTATPSAEPSVSPSTEPSIAPTDTPIRNIDRPIIKEFVNLSQGPRTCDLCPPTGTLATPEKLISMVNINNQTVTKTCGALLWDTRAGRNDMDAAACSFLQPFFGAACGCSTFTPLSHDSGQAVIGTQASTGQCKLCESPTHVFQKPYASLRIPGSKTTKITCGGLFSGAKNGAVTANECGILSNLADACGGCGPVQSSVLQARFYQEPVSEKQAQNTEQCIDCQSENESSIYVYKDFGDSGTTFHKAFAAPLHCDFRSRRQEKTHHVDYSRRQQSARHDDCPRLFHPELEGCVLAPITSFDELLKIQSVIPPQKAAYTAVYKSKLDLKQDAEKCYSAMKIDAREDASFEVSGSGISRRLSGEDCKIENWLDGLKFGYSHNDEDESTAKSTKTNDATDEALDACPSMKVGWTNYNTGTDVPQSVWNNGEPSYCNRGPIQEVGAVWAVESNGQNYGDLRDVSTSWLLPGAVYKCCKTIYSCFGDTN